MTYPLPKFSVIVTLLLSIFLTACSSHRYVADDSWPKDMPPKSIFVEAYESDTHNKSIQTQDEYMLWIVRFYKGWELYRRGWLSMTDELMSQISNPSEAEEIEERIYRVGVKMSSEWAKKSDTRTIYLRHVYVWGNALLESIEQNNCLELVTRVEQDIDDLIARKIDKTAITADRYFAVDPDNPFL